MSLFRSWPPQRGSHAPNPAETGPTAWALRAPPRMIIRPFARSDSQAVIALWEACGLTRPWNDPRADIERKLGEQPEGFLVGVADGELMASVMVGFDGHRGWVNYLAVAPRHRRQAHGRALLREAERLLLEKGCPKLNLQVRSSNREAIAFYERLGFIQDDVVGLGKRLIHDRPDQRE